LRVSLEIVHAEMDAGRLPVIRIGDEQRILKSQLIMQGTLSDRAGRASARGEEMNEVEPEIGSFSRNPNFDQPWPDGTSEHYENVYQATVNYLGRIIHVVIGSTQRSVAGRDREKIVVLLNGVNYSQFTGANGKSTGLVLLRYKRA
jgi:hypothetical protein